MKTLRKWICPVLIGSGLMAVGAFGQSGGSSSGGGGHPMLAQSGGSSSGGGHPTAAQKRGRLKRRQSPNPGSNSGSHLS
jgi:hypothetical protein